MISKLKKAGLGLALAATALTAAAPAEAQRYRGYRDGYRGDRAGTAVVAGLAGLAVGAAIASNNRGRYYYDDGFYDRRYYRRNFRPRGDFYAYRGGYGPRYRCYSVREWDPYYGRPIRTRICR